MKRGKLILMLAMMLLCSVSWGCGSDDSCPEPNPCRSSLMPEFENVSSGYTDGELGLANLEEVSVYASVSGSSSLLFDNVTLRLVDGKWNYSGDKYWEPDRDYKFYGIAPVGSSAWSVSLENQGRPDEKCTLSYNLPSSGGKLDLITAASDVITTPSELPVKMDPVKFNFRHLLCQIRFTFINELVNPYYVINVDYGIMLDPVTNGTIDLAGENAQWTTERWFDTYLGFGKGQAYVDIPYKTQPLFILPGHREGMKVTFQTQLFYCPDGNLSQFKELTHSCPHSVTLPPMDYEMGKSYNFIAHLTPANVLGDGGGELSGITFDVEEQWRWDAVTDIWE